MSVQIAMEDVSNSVSIVMDHFHVVVELAIQLIVMAHVQVSPYKYTIYACMCKWYAHVSMMLYIQNSILLNVHTHHNIAAHIYLLYPHCVHAHTHTHTHTLSRY